MCWLNKSTPAGIFNSGVPELVRFTEFEGDDALGGLEDDDDALEESDKLSDRISDDHHGGATGEDASSESRATKP